MNNGVGDVNSEVPPNCTLEDIRRRGQETTYWSIDSDGEPQDYLDHTESDFYVEDFFCGNCGEDFNSFTEVKEHLDEVRES